MSSIMSHRCMQLWAQGSSRFRVPKRTQKQLSSESATAVSKVRSDTGTKMAISILMPSEDTYMSWKAPTRLSGAAIS
jgi:hypothetical protein